MGRAEVMAAEARIAAQWAGAGQGDELGRLALAVAALACQAKLRGDPKPAHQLRLVGSGYMAKGDWEQAERCLALAAGLDPGLAEAWMDLAALAQRDGRLALAQGRRARAYGAQRLFAEPAAWAAPPSDRFLALRLGSASGNVPFEALLSSSGPLRIDYVLDWAQEREDAELPA